MANITNDFSWSITRGQSFQGCPRAYYFNYYGFWNGWKSDCDEHTRLIYTLKNVKTLILWAGSIVHDTIKEALSAYVATGRKATLEELQNAAVQKMRNGWIENVKGAWKTYPKKTNLFELYYGAGEEYGTCKSLPKEETDSIKQRVLDCMEGFYYTPMAKMFYAVPTANWKPIDALAFFMFEDTKIWCAPDFAFEDADGLFHIVDWKTGGENRATISQQLTCYCLFAMDQWGIPLENLRIHGVFLKDGGRVQNYEVKPVTVDVVRQQMRDSIRAMRTKLTDPEKNEAKEEDFPPKPSEFQCGTCVFRRICAEEN